MPKGKFIAHREDMITANSFSSDADDNKSLGADQLQIPKAHATTHDMGLSSAILQH
jgi:hypothetical protein